MSLGSYDSKYHTTHREFGVTFNKLTPNNSQYNKKTGKKKVTHFGGASKFHSPSEKSEHHADLRKKAINKKK